MRPAEPQPLGCPSAPLHMDSSETPGCEHINHRMVILPIAHSQTDSRTCTHPFVAHVRVMCELSTYSYRLRMSRPRHKAAWPEKAMTPPQTETALVHGAEVSSAITSQKDSAAREGGVVHLPGTLSAQDDGHAVSSQLVFTTLSSCSNCVRMHLLGLWFRHTAQL